MAEKKTTQTKASMRNGRATKGGAVYNANHNTLESIRRDQPHIDAQKFELNRYWKFEQKDRTFSIKKIDGGKGGFDARKHELAIYEKLYGDGLAARNERYTREGHKDRCQTIKNLYSNPKTAPLETIFQIGNSQMILDGVMGPEEMKQKLTAAWDKTMRQVVSMGKGMVIPLDAALHCEEAVPHIHFRAALGARDRYGHFVPNQSAALKAMGFDGRNPDTGKKDRYHNPLVAYTDRVREIFYTITVPATLEAGQSGTVTANGAWHSGQVLKVSVPESIAVSYNGQSIDVGVTFDDINQRGNDISVMNITKDISLEDVSATFGTWTGVIEYNVEVAELITFSISKRGLDDERTYYAEDGMTYLDWINSDYNTDGYIQFNGMLAIYHNDENGDRQLYRNDRPGGQMTSVGSAIIKQGASTELYTV